VIEDRRQMLEAMPDRPSLPRGVLEDHHRLATRPRRERVANRRRDEPQRGVLRPCRARARMNDDAEKAKGVRAIELVDQGVDRLCAQRRIGGREVDEITRVRDRRGDARFFDAPTEASDLVCVKRPSAPLVGVLREDLQRFASVNDGAVNRFRDTARH
jgi:hypothetical protein